MPRLHLIPAVFAVTLLFLLSPAASAQTESPADLERLHKEIKAIEQELKAKEQQLLTPTAEDFSRHADFLKQPDTGLIRLLPREIYEQKLRTRGGGAYYSFTRLTHEYGTGSDLELQQGQLSSGFAGANFGFLTSLGDIPLESISFDYPGMKFLTELAAPSVEESARTLYKQGHPGVEADNFKYSRQLKASADNTYALRSINYHTSDVLVAFRVVRLEEDGSLVILWKMLKRFPKPELARSN